MAAALIVAFAAAQPSAGQWTPGDVQQTLPTFRTEVNYVEVDVTVTDSRGEFARGLRLEDFEVFEDGRPQEISTFGLVDLPYEVRSPQSVLPAARIEADVRTNVSDSEGHGLGPTAFLDELRRAQDSLRVLSDETGGIAVVSSNEFAEAFERILRDNSIYYVLGYHSSDTRRDGKFRRIEVRVKRPGLRVRARQGYLAPSGRDAAPGAAVTAGTEPSAVRRELLNQPLPVSGIPIRAFAAPFKAAGRHGSVLVGLEVQTQHFVFGQEDGSYTNTVEAAVVALDHQGRFLEGDRQRIELRLRPETREVVQTKGLRLLFRLNLPQGRYQLRAAAHEAGSHAVGSVHYDVQVPDFAKEPLSLSGVVLTSTSTAPIPTPRPDPDLEPLLRQPPTGSPEFTPEDTLMVACALYHNPEHLLDSVTMAATVEGEDGRVRFSHEIELSDEDLRAAPHGYGYVLQIPVVDLGPGAHVLRVRATARLAGKAAVLREVPFRVRMAERSAR